MTTDAWDSHKVKIHSVQNKERKQKTQTKRSLNKDSEENSGLWIVLRKTEKSIPQSKQLLLSSSLPIKFLSTAKKANKMSFDKAESHFL